MMLVMAPEAARAVAGTLRAAGEQVHEIGRIVARRPGMAAATVEGMAAAWNG
jgi:phosphoribosylaminoimidazole (AIR) synthetase